MELIEQVSLSPAEFAAAEEFEWSVKTGDTRRVRNFVSECIQRKEVPKWFDPLLAESLLCRAIMHKDATIVSLILKLHPPLCYKTEERKLSSLWIAVIFANSEIVQTLIGAGADVNRRFGANAMHDPDSSLLHYLVTSVNPAREELVDAILQHGGDIDARDSTGKTALHYAVLLNDLMIVPALVAKGANVNAANRKGESPLLGACKSSAKEEMILLLMENGANIYARTPEGLNALHLLANSTSYDENSEAAVAELLLERGLPVDQLDDVKQYTPLHYAVLRGKEKMTKILLERKADPNGPLHLAAAGKSACIIEMLLKKEAKIDRTTVKGKTALHIACQNVQEKNITVLLDYGANINALDNEGATAFSLIEFKNLSLSIQAMIRRFAKHTALNKPTNKTDLEIIKEYPKLNVYYENCLKEIDEMKRFKLFSNLSYFSMFSKTLVKLAFSFRDPRFQFPLNIKQIDELFPIYCSDFNRTLSMAESLYVDLNLMEHEFNLIFSSIVPHTIIREIMIKSLPYYVCT